MGLRAAVRRGPYLARVAPILSVGFARVAPVLGVGFTWADFRAPRAAVPRVGRALARTILLK